MKHKIFYFTGTGNSLMVARKLGELLGNSEVSSIVMTEDESLREECDTIGIVFPVYWGGLPFKVLKFLSKLKKYRECYTFGVATHAGGPGRALQQLRFELLEVGLELSSGFALEMPTNFVIGDTAPSASIIRTHLENADHTIIEIVDTISNKKSNIPSDFKSYNGQSSRYERFLSEVQSSDENFWVDENCTECELCAEVCPVQNILMEKGRPEWLHHCEQCLACINWCPESAIQFGQQTKNSGRYKNPRVAITDLVKSVQ